MINGKDTCRSVEEYDLKKNQEDAGLQVKMYIL
jgi:hypothetical protein